MKERDSDSTRPIYLNHASVSSPFPETVKSATQFIEKWSHATFPYGAYMIDLLDTTKHKLSRLLNQSHTSFSIVPNTAIGLSMVLNSHTFEPGDEIIILDNEFPSNAYPYLVQKSKGVRVVQVSAEDFYQNPVQTLEAARTSRTVLFAISLVGYTSGFLCDLDLLSAYCREHHIIFFVDGTQGTGVVPVDLTQTPIDVYVTSGYKWLKWPNAMAFLSIRPDYLATLQSPFSGWLSPEERPHISYPLQAPQTQSGQIFEPGGMNLFGLTIASHALDITLDLTVAFLRKEIQVRTDLILQEIQKRDLKTAIPYSQARTAGIISFYPQSKSQECFNFLHDQNIWLTHRHGLFRLSPHYDTPLEDIGLFFEGLDRFYGSL